MTSQTSISSGADGDRIELREEHTDRFKVFVPPYRRDWIEVVRQIPGRAWNAQLKYWSVPYVKDSFRRLWQNPGRAFLTLHFEIRADIPETHVNRRQPLVAKAPPKEPLPKAQQVALTKLEENLILESKSWRTVKTYTSLFRQFLLFSGSNFLPEEAKATDIERFLLKKRQQEQASDSQMNQLINALNAYFVRVRERPELTSKLRRPRRKQKLPNVFSEDEIKRLLSACRNLKHKCMLILIYSGGLRRSELLDLRVEDLNAERGTIYIKNGKGGKDRYTFYSETAKRFLLPYLKQYKPRHYLFEGQTGGRYGESSLQSIFETAKTRSGVNRFVTLHGLRHSFATHLVEKGTPLHVVQQLLGHRSLKTTEVYLHISNRYRDSLRSPLDDMEL